MMAVGILIQTANLKIFHASVRMGQWFVTRVGQEFMVVDRENEGWLCHYTDGGSGLHPEMFLRDQCKKIKKPCQN